MRLFSLALCLMLSQAQASTPTLNDHMRAMAELLAVIHSRVESRLGYPQAADATREFRGHQVLAISLIPSKFAKMSEVERASEMIVFHKIMARSIYLSATLERALSDEDYVTESLSLEEDVRNLLKDLEKLASEAHEKFR